MASAFDPYLQWLSIRDPQRPPNHYRLLGLELFENDASVIAMSADRQMAHLRNFKTGPEADVAERLLNELSAARICLLKAERKAAYDNQLRAALKPAPASRPLPPAAPLVKAAAPAAMPAVRPSGTNAKGSMPAAKAAWKPWAILAALVILCGGLTALLINKNSPGNDEKLAVAKQGGESQVPATKDKPKPQTPVKPAEITPVVTKSPSNTEPKKNESVKKDLPNEQGSKTITKPQTVNASGGNNKKPSPEQPSTTNTAPPNTDPTTLLGEEVDPKIPEKSTGSETPATDPPKEPEANLIAQAPVVAAAPPARLAIPDKAAVSAKEKEIREIFPDEYKSPKPEVKAAFAAKLRQNSEESKNNSTERYVLLNEARNNAILGGAVKLAVDVTDELIRDYDVSESDERFGLFSKLLAGGMKNVAYSQLVLDELRKSIDKLQADDEYDIALKFINIAARSMRDPALVTELTQRAKELNLQKTSFQRAKVAKETLAKNLNDPAANEAWGAYLSFTKGEFQSGLPFLARGTSTDLADLATRELSNKQSQTEQLQLADDWWAYGEKVQTQDAVRSLNIRQHAGQKYGALFPKLSGIEKAKAEKRINELNKISDQNSKSEIERRMKQLISTKWQVDFAAPGSTPETMVFRPDGTMTNRVFTSWVIEKNELILKGSMIGKIKFNGVSFDVDYHHLDGRLDYQGKARPATQ